MNANEPVRITIDAANALTEWKFRFAVEVCERAKQLAAESSEPTLITLSHYRQAATIALESLSRMIHGEDRPDGRKEAA